MGDILRSSRTRFLFLVVAVIAVATWSRFREGNWTTGTPAPAKIQNCTIAIREMKTVVTDGQSKTGTIPADHELIIQSSSDSRHNKTFIKIPRNAKLEVKLEPTDQILPDDPLLIMLVYTPDRTSGGLTLSEGKGSAILTSLVLPNQIPMGKFQITAGTHGNGTFETRTFYFERVDKTWEEMQKEQLTQLPQQ
jgi:hypothetical protein